jgi:transcriptional regulator with XRE-family HTH domain
MTPDQFRATLKSLGLRQTHLAERLGVHRTTVSRWSTGDLAIPRYVEYVLELLAQSAA